MPPLQVRDAVAHHDLPVGVRGHPRLVGDQHHRRAGVPGGLGEQPHHPFAVERVERAGRFVGEDHPRAGDQRAGHRDALPLAAGDLAGALAGDVGRPPAVPATRAARCSAVLRRVTRASRSGRAMFSRQVSSGTSWPNWKTNPNVAAPQRAALGVAHRRQVLAVEDDPAPSRAAGSRPGSAAGWTCRSRTDPSRRRPRPRRCAARRRRRAAVSPKRLGAGPRRPAAGRGHRRTCRGQLVEAGGGEFEPAQVGLQVEQGVVADQLVGEVAVALAAGQLPHRRRCSARCTSSSSAACRPVSRASTTLV